MILGISYFYGDGVDKNVETAVNWVRKAAEQGFGKAQNRLGVFYRDGIGIGANPVEAYAWFSAAIANGFNDAAKNKQELEKSLNAEQLKQAQDLAMKYSAEYVNK